MRVLDEKSLKARRRPRGAAEEEGASSERTRAVVLCPILKSSDRNTRRRPRAGTDPVDQSERSALARLSEAVGLARAIDLDVCHKGLVQVARPRPATLFGSGKVEELAGVIGAERAGLVIVDRPVTPVQQRNLEKAWGAKVLDRTGLILEIFGRRALTKEGRLQVELAHLTYQKSRLVRSWTHLERQRGGFGFLGGPGETQIEADRRVIQDRIAALRQELETVARTRGLHRESRRRVPYPIVALVGYTNAGKSTLFNRLTGAAVIAENMLFATLDPTMREVVLPACGKVILSDTVGFISDLPTALIAAFRATLEEVVEADLILHVRDMAHGDSATQSTEVEAILDQLGVDEEARRTKLLEVWNKIDLLDGPVRERVENAARRLEGRVKCVSAATGEGIDGLMALMAAHIGQAHETIEFNLGSGDGALAHWVHENSEVLSRSVDDDGHLTFRVRIPREKKGALLSRLPEAPI